MQTVELILRKLQAAGIGTEGKDLFLHNMPSDVRAGTVILPSLLGSSLSFEMPDFRKDSAFQVIVRAPRVELAFPNARKIFNELTVTKRVILPGIPPDIPSILVSYIHPVHDPQPFPRLPDNSWEISMNFLMSYAIQKGT